jgi:hypothetical protein
MENFLNKNINKYYLEDKHAKQWDIIFDHIKKTDKGVIDPNIVIQRYLINYNTEPKTINGAMDLLYTEWWLDSKKYSKELVEEKNIIKKNDDARKKAKEEGYKEASDKYTKVKAATNTQSRKEDSTDANLKRYQLKKELLSIETERDNLEAEIKKEKSKGHKTRHMYDKLPEYAGKIFRIKNELSKLN